MNEKPTEQSWVDQLVFNKSLGTVHTYGGFHTMLFLFLFYWLNHFWTIFQYFWQNILSCFLFHKIWNLKFSNEWNIWLTRLMIDPQVEILEKEEKKTSETKKRFLIHKTAIVYKLRYALSIRMWKKFF